MYIKKFKEQNINLSTFRGTSMKVLFKKLATGLLTAVMVFGSVGGTMLVATTAQADLSKPGF